MNVGYERLLAPYAMSSSKSRGRRSNEPEHEYRLPYQRDRDRIIHTTAFRRLEYKTQVFVNHEGDHYRTRLTHTIEVSQIARTITRALLLNEDLTEAIALAHDLGHTPFGHSGEDTLREIMKDHGGFDHNIQGLRVVDILEERYPDFKGLNLSYEVREGIIKHSSPYDEMHFTEEFSGESSPTLETQVVDFADEIAYDSHDLDDGLTSGILAEGELEEIELWNDIHKQIQQSHKGITSQQKRYLAIRTIINKCVSDLVSNSQKNIKDMGILSVDDVRRRKERIIGFSSVIDSQRKSLREYLSKNLYQNYRVMRMAEKASRFIRELFDIYLKKPQTLPRPFRDRVREEKDPHTAICDYIAGMTDRYALDEYKKFFEPYERV